MVPILLCQFLGHPVQLTRNRKKKKELTVSSSLVGVLSWRKSCQNMSILAGTLPQEYTIYCNGYLGAL